MTYKITISDGTILEKCIEHVAFNVDTSSDFSSRNTNIKNSIIITGKIDSDESTVALYEWALLPATNQDCYKEITVEQYSKNLLLRKVHFSKAFVVDYAESYSNYVGTGTFTLYVRQFINKEIEVTSEETAVNNIVTETTDTIEETVEEVHEKVAVVSSVLPLKKKNINITDKLAKRNEMQDNSNITVKYGEHFTKKDRKKVLKPNIQYITPEGYTYKTDSIGRIISCEGTLQNGVAKRKAHAQKTVGREDRKKDDDGGHLIASIFKGSGDYDNLVAMNGNLNKGEWKKLENSWSNAINEKPPQQVQTKITPIYKGDSQRPDLFIVEYKVGDKPWNRKKFKNTPGGK